MTVLWLHGCWIIWLLTYGYALGRCHVETPIPLLCFQTSQLTWSSYHVNVLIMVAIKYSFDYGKLPNVLPNYTIPNHDAPSCVLHNLINYTIAQGFLKPLPTPLFYHQTPYCWNYFHMRIRLSFIAPPSNPYTLLSIHAYNVCDNPKWEASSYSS